MTSAPQRIVSLVPSDTFNLSYLGAEGRLVGRTTFCTEPASVQGVAVVGGPKSIDVDAVMSLRPELVLANREENSRLSVTALIERGLKVHLRFPRTVEGGRNDLRELAGLLGLEHLSGAEACGRGEQPMLRALVLIWRNPWISANGDTHVSDMLRRVGLLNVCQDWASMDGCGRDSRYPSLSDKDLSEAAPDVIVLPNEPYAFTKRDEADIRKLVNASARILRVDGRDLTWPGAWSFAGEERLRGQVEKLGGARRT